jgi:sigma-E factor negative regulatory protein RseB
MPSAPRDLRSLGVLSCLTLVLAGAPAVDQRALARESTADEAAALSLLERAVRAARTVGYTGTQYVASWSAEASTSTLAEVAHEPSAGAVITSTGTPGAGSESAVALGPARLDRHLLEALAEQYELVVSGSARCTGRAASVVEARRVGVQGDGAVAGRLWLDRESGLLLRREVYDDTGRRVHSSAFVDVSITSGGVEAAPIERARQRERATAVSAAGPERAAGGLARLRRHDWQAPDRLPGGFVLFDVRLRTGSGGAPSLAHLTYSDGLSTLSLFAQRGDLGNGPAGSFSPTSMGGAQVWVHGSTPERVVWSGGGQVWTLVSDAPREVVEASVAALPHDAPRRDGLLPRLGRGLARIGAALNPFA